MEDAIKYVDPNSNYGSDPFSIVDGELDDAPYEGQAEELAQAAEEARDFFNSNLFRTLGTTDQYYIEKVINLLVVYNAMYTCVYIVLKL